MHGLRAEEEWTTRDFFHPVGREKKARLLASVHCTRLADNRISKRSVAESFLLKAVPDKNLHCRASVHFAPLGDERISQLVGV